jgi:hypothetical protein
MAQFVLLPFQFSFMRPCQSVISGSDLERECIPFVVVPFRWRLTLAYLLLFSEVVRDVMHVAVSWIPLISLTI